MTDKSWNLNIRYHERTKSWAMGFAGDAPDGYVSLGVLLDDLEYTLEDGVADGSDE